MLSHTNKGAALAAPAIAGVFDPALWLEALTGIGGGYALTSDRRLVFLVEDCDGEPLAMLMGQVIGRPDRQDALKGSIERRQCGEVA